MYPSMISMIRRNVSRIVVFPIVFGLFAPMSAMGQVGRSHFGGGHYGLHGYHGHFGPYAHHDHWGRVTGRGAVLRIALRAIPY